MTVSKSTVYMLKMCRKLIWRLSRTLNSSEYYLKFVRCYTREESERVT